LPLQVADQTAGLLHQQQPGGDVPVAQPHLPEAIETPGRHVSQIERRGARPAHARGIGDQRPQRPQVPVQILGIPERNPRTQQGTVEVDAVTHPNAAIIQQRTSSPRGGEEFLPQRIVDHGLLQPIPVFQGDRDREMRHPVQEVRGAVQRVDDPHEVVPRLVPAFLGEDAVIRVGMAQDLHDRLLGLQIHLGHEVVARFLADAQRVRAVPGARGDPAGRPCGLHGGIQHGMHGRDSGCGGVGAQTIHSPVRQGKM
jgi:hypothetical protein